MFRREERAWWGRRCAAERWNSPGPLQPFFLNRRYTLTSLCIIRKPRKRESLIPDSNLAGQKNFRPTSSWPEQCHIRLCTTRPRMYGSPTRILSSPQPSFVSSPRLRPNRQQAMIADSDYCLGVLRIDSDAARMHRRRRPLLVMQRGRGRRRGKVEHAGRQQARDKVVRLSVSSRRKERLDQFIRTRTKWWVRGRSRLRLCKRSRPSKAAALSRGGREVLAVAADLLDSDARVGKRAEEIQSWGAVCPIRLFHRRRRKLGARRKGKEGVLCVVGRRRRRRRRTQLPVWSRLEPANLVGDAVLVFEDGLVHDPEGAVASCVNGEMRTQFRQRREGGLRLALRCTCEVLVPVGGSRTQNVQCVRHPDFDALARRKLRLGMRHSRFRDDRARRRRREPDLIRPLTGMDGVRGKERRTEYGNGGDVDGAPGWGVQCRTVERRRGPKGGRIEHGLREGPQPDAAVRSRRDEERLNGVHVLE